MLSALSETWYYYRQIHLLVRRKYGTVEVVHTYAKCTILDAETKRRPILSLHTWVVRLLHDTRRTVLLKREIQYCYVNNTTQSKDSVKTLFQNQLASQTYSDNRLSQYLHVLGSNDHSKRPTNRRFPNKPNKYERHSDTSCGCIPPSSPAASYT